MIIKINFDSYLELEKIANGTFYPLKGFMNEEDFHSVVKSMRLFNGKIFPVPVLLPISKILIKNLKKSQEIDLVFNKKKVGSLVIESIFKLNVKKYIKNLYGTEDYNHPGYKILLNFGNTFIGGRVNSFFQINHKYSSLALDPKKIKGLKKKFNLKTLAGFQTRNVPHRAHEYIIMDALKEVDGVFINPLIGRKKKGDFAPEAIIKSFNYLINNEYPKNKFILGALTTYMRYAGPREALFHALIRKNYGCTHFLVGRDHAGVGNYYGLYEAQELCSKYETEIGLKIIKVRGPFYCNFCNKITNDKYCKHKANQVEVSGTKIREALLNNYEIEDIFMRKEIVQLIKKEKIFI